MNSQTRVLGWLLEGICAIFVLLFGGMLFLWTVISTQIAWEAPEVANLRTPALVFAETTTVCVIAFVICLWVLIHKALVGRVFEDATLKWLYMMISMCVISALCALVCVIMVPLSPATYALVAGMLFCVGVAILLLILRNLLKQAISQQDELAGVI